MGRFEGVNLAGEERRASDFRGLDSWLGMLSGKGDPAWSPWLHLASLHTV